MIRINTIKYVTSLDNFNDVVIQLNWEYSLEGFQTIGGTLELPLPSSNTFIPIEDLEQSIMVGWVEELVNPTSMELQPVIEEVVINTINFE
jgi:hypothetical protein